jgi:hypothetical protein
MKRSKSNTKTKELDHIEREYLAILPRGAEEFDIHWGYKFSNHICSWEIPPKLFKQLPKVVQEFGEKMPQDTYYCFSYENPTFIFEEWLRVEKVKLILQATFVF